MPDSGRAARRGAAPSTETPGRSNLRRSPPGGPAGPEPSGALPRGQQGVLPGYADQAYAEVEVRRSPRRRRTVSAYREGDRVVVLLPARMSRTEERKWVRVMLERIAAQERRRRPSDDELLARAAQLGHRFLDDRARPSSVRWVDNQTSRWGSCTPSDRTVRLSSRLQGMPAWVVDYVLLHELAHLLEAGHTPAFWDLVGRYPLTERARGFLEGVAAAASLSIVDCADEKPPDAPPTGDELAADATVQASRDEGVTGQSAG